MSWKKLILKMIYNYREFKDVKFVREQIACILKYFGRNNVCQLKQISK